MQLCFVCDKDITKAKKYLVDTRDDQTVYVGSECYKRIKEAGENGYNKDNHPLKCYLIDEVNHPTRHL